MTNRLPSSEGEVLDRTRALTFTWNGKKLQGFEGDTIASALMAIGVVRFINRRRRFWFPPLEEEMPEPAGPSRPAHEVALERLTALLAEGLLQKGAVPLFVQRLMDDVLRSYLEDRFDASAGTRTTRELCEALLSLSTLKLR